MKRDSVLVVGLCGLSLLDACGGGSSAPVVVSLQPNSHAAIDGGQSVALTATVSGDSGQGVSWTVSCPTGVSTCGSMAQATSASGSPDNFTGDAAASGTSTVTITATSVADPTKFASLPVTVNPMLTASSPPLQTAFVGVAFNLSILSLLQGGTSPVTCTPATGTLPANLSFDASTSTVMGTATAAAPPVVIGFACKDSASPPAALAQNLQVSIQVLVAPPPSISMVVPRMLHTATLLPSGSVLFAGGLTTTPGVLSVQYAIPTPTAELYDPASTAFTPTGDLTSARSKHTATLLKTGQVLIAGGKGSTELAATAELYDPATARFVTTGSLRNARTGHTATMLLTGEVLLTGGTDASGAALQSAEIYDPGTGKFTATGSMGTARTLHAAALLGDGRVLICGGDAAGRSRLATAEIYNPASGAFTPTGQMREARSEFTATLVAGGRVLVIGGFGASGATGGRPVVPLSSAELYDSSAGHFLAIVHGMTAARARHSATVRSNGTVLIAGGSNHWVDQNQFCHHHPGTPCSVLEPTSSVEVFDPASGLFAGSASLAMGRDAHTATLLPDGTPLVAGGEIAIVASCCGGQRFEFLGVTPDAEAIP